MSTTRIQIERLTSGIDIIIPGFGPAEVYGVRFDGEGYAVDYARSARGGWDDLDTHYVEAGGSVEFAGVGEPVLRSEQFISRDEWEARAEAVEADCLHLQGKLNQLQGYVCREIDERPLVSAVAAAVGVPALVAEVA